MTDTKKNMLDAARDSGHLEIIHVGDNNPTRNRTFSPETERQDELKRASIYPPAVEGGLHQALIEIARVQLDNSIGPNSWDEVTAEDFGPENDFTVTDHGTIFIFDCLSDAALQWCYYHFPEDAPRWGVRGFAVEHRFIGAIVAAAREDGLLSRQDYEDNMYERDAAERQGENL